MAELADLRGRLLELGRLWAAGDIDRQEWLIRKERVHRRVLAAEAQLDRVVRRAALERLLERGSSVRSRWHVLDVEEQRQILDAALRYVVVLAAGAPRRVFRADRLRPVWQE